MKGRWTALLDLAMLQSQQSTWQKVVKGRWPVAPSPQHFKVDTDLVTIDATVAEVLAMKPLADAFWMGFQDGWRQFWALTAWPFGLLTTLKAKLIRAFK